MNVEFCLTHNMRQIIYGIKEMIKTHLRDN